jgi:MFS family permease
MKNTEKILLCASNIWIFADGLLGPLFAIYTEKIGGDIFDITFAYALYLAVTGILVILVGKISDKSEKLQKKLLIGGYFLTAISTLMYLFVSNTFELFIVQIFLGVALAMCNPTWYALYDKYSTKNKEGFLWGLSDGLGKIFTAIAVILGGLIVNYFSFEVLFISMASIQFLAALYLLKIYK